MAFKDIWRPRVDGVDDVDSSAVNEIAEAVIEMDEHKQEALTDEQLQNIEDVSKKADKEYVDNNFANALKGNKIGQSVTLDDVSPIEHMVDVKVKSKNIITTFSARDAAASGIALSVTMSLEKGKTYTFSFDTENTGARMWHVSFGSTKTYIQYITNTGTKTCDGTRQYCVFVALQDCKNTNFSMLQATDSTPSNTGLCSNPMVEEGETATEYSQYVEDVAGYGVTVTGADESYNEYFAGADGVIGELVSTYPSMGFMAIANSGVYANNVVADVTYNRDINKAFAELEQKLTNAVISLGGNV